MRIEWRTAYSAAGVAPVRGWTTGPYDPKSRRCFISLTFILLYPHSHRLRPLGLIICIHYSCLSEANVNVTTISFVNTIQKTSESHVWIIAEAVQQNNNKGMYVKRHESRYIYKGEKCSRDDYTQLFTVTINKKQHPNQQQQRYVRKERERERNTGSIRSQSDPGEQSSSSNAEGCGEVQRGSAVSL